MPGPAVMVNSGDEIIVNWRARLAGPALLSGMGSLDPTDLAETVNPVLTSGDSGICELV